MAGAKIRPMLVNSRFLVVVSGPTPRPRFSTARGRPPKREVARSVDELFESYLRWREACDDLRAAYERWDDCPPGQRVLAFDGYLAALEREERAAHAHSQVSRRSSRNARVHRPE